MILIDAPYLCWQSYYTRFDGMDKSDAVIYLFMKQMLFLGRRFSTNDFVFCWEGGSSVRREIYPEYKMNRKDKIPEEAVKTVLTAVERLRDEILPCIGFCNQISQRGLEADDMIARICVDSLEDIVVYSGDEDLYQCLYPHVTVYNNRTGIMNHKKFFEEYGIEFWKWAWVKAIAGCSSDNIKGFPGIGEKTAVRYLTKKLPVSHKKYRDIHTVKCSKLIEDNMKIVRLPHPLTKTVNLSVNKFSKKEFIRICEKYEFGSFLNRINDWRDFFTGYKTSVKSLLNRSVK